MFIGNTHMNVNNVLEGIDPSSNQTAPVINVGRTMVSIRANVARTAQCAREWRAANEMDIVLQVVNDRTLIPLRFVAELLGSQIEGIGSQQMVVIVYYLQQREYLSIITSRLLTNVGFCDKIHTLCKKMCKNSPHEMPKCISREKMR